MTDTSRVKRKDQMKILEMQRDLMNGIMGYQIHWGVEAISWNVSVQFKKGDVE